MTLSLSQLLNRGFGFRAASRLFVVMALTGFALPAQSQQAAANSVPIDQIPPADSSRSISPIKIQYTGRLFGYYRVEPDIGLDNLQKEYDADVEARKSNPTAPGSSALLARPGAFLRHRQQTSSDLLLGMGDNFGPEFGASIQQEFSDKSCSAEAPKFVPGKLNTYVPESLFKAETRLPNFADCDNVTRFLMVAGYRAVVPGREDFLYTGTWLRRVAYLLRGASAVNRKTLNPSTPTTVLTPVFQNKWTFGSMPIASNDHELHMLAANLRVSVTPEKDAESGAAKPKICPLLFASDLGTAIECGSSDSSISASMDWLARVDAALKPEIRVAIERQALDGAFSKQLLKNEIATFNTIVRQASLQSAVEDKESEAARSHDNCTDLNRRLDEIVNFNPDMPAKGSTKAAAPPANSSPSLCLAALGLVNEDLDKLTNAMEKAIRDFKAGYANRKLPAVPPLDEAALRSAQRLLLQIVYKEQQDVGFTIAKLPGGQRVLIIGIAGKETMQEVAPDFFRAYPDIYDCRQAAQSSPLAPPESPACKLKSKLGISSEPETLKDTSLTEAAVKKYDPYQITVGDPLVAAEFVLRAVWAHEQREKQSIDRTILMAQMPATEAEEVGAQLRYDIGAASNPIFDSSNLSIRPRIDLVLSEAQDEHTTGNQVVEINPLRSTVVLSPPLAYESIARPEWYPPSIATIAQAGGNVPHGIQITNTLGYIEDYSPRAAITPRVATTRAQEQEDEQLNTGNLDSSSQNTAASLLEFMLTVKLPQAHITPPLREDLNDPWIKCSSSDSKTENRRAIATATANCQNQVLTAYLLHTLQNHYKTSAAVLKRRDFWFGELATGYSDYKLCDDWATNVQGAKDYCRLHVALDRVLWRGDYGVRVLVDGTTLTSVLKASSRATSIETTRLANDLHQEWLSTFGVVSDPATNLVAAASGPESFSLPGVDGCSVAADPPLGKKTGAPTPKPTCVDGFTIASDAAYWIATSGQLAKDQSTYKDIQSFTQKSSHFVADRDSCSPMDTFLTTAIACEIIPYRPRSNVALASVPSGKSSAQNELAQIEAASQRRRLMQVDISKFAAGYTFTSPSINDTDLGNDLAGVSNTQATTPHSAELDLEAAGRAVTAPVYWQSLVLGIQNDFEFDHKRTGNTTGKPATVSYQLNSETVGAFAQIHIPQIFGSKPGPSLSMQGPRDLPRFYWVIAPYQYQSQIVGSPLYFGYLTPPYTKNPSQQLTVTVPVSDGFIWKTGLRFEGGGFKKAWAPDSGTYAEVGPEYVIQNNILYGISMPDLSGLSNPVTTHCFNPCLVTAGTSITSAVQGYYKDNNQTLNGASHLKPLTQTVHAGGLYWTAHVQKILNKAKTYSVSFDTAGDAYLLPGYTLPTQTRYAINSKLAFNVNFFGNLSFSPTYSIFNYENQGEPAKRVPLNTTSFQGMLKWYYGRDTQSPPWRLLWFSGPKSGDQTGSTKMK